MSATTLTPLTLDGRSLRIDEVVDVARTAPPRPPIRLSDDVITRMEAAVRLKHKLLNAQQPIYGVTTGFGDSAHRQISPEKAARLQLNLIRYHLNGQGPAAADDTVRATMLIRANCLARGASGVRPAVAQQLLDHLHHDLLPVIPEQGSLGASGDLVPLCYLSASLVGEGQVRYRGALRDAAEAQADAGLAPLELEAKDALALINGTAFMSAFAALAVNDAAELALIADLCTALTCEALEGNRSHFSPFIHRQKPHAGQVASAAAIAEVLAQSSLAREHSQIIGLSDELGGRAFQELTRSIQDRYSLRCAPHVNGVLRDTVGLAQRWVEVEMNSANDNPLFDAEDQTVHSGGNFYGGHIAQAMDSLKVAMANTVDLMDRQLAMVVDEKFNKGLTPNLIPAQHMAGEEAGLHHGYKGIQIAASSITAEVMKTAATPASLFSRSTEAHNQDKVSLGTIAARDARDVAAMARSVAAMHLHALCQALDLRGPGRAAPRTRAVHDLVRSQVGFLDRDRRMQEEVDHLVAAIADGSIRRAAWPGSASALTEATREVVVEDVA